MEDKLVIFDTAKLAKEKNFNIPVYSYFDKNGELNMNYSIINQYPNEYLEEYGESIIIPYKSGDGSLSLEKINFNSWKDSYSAPTRTDLQDWLREEKGIKVYCVPSALSSRTNDWIYVISRTGYEHIHQNSIFNTYEEALELGLQEGLKLYELN